MVGPPTLVIIQQEPSQQFSSVDIVSKLTPNKKCENTKFFLSGLINDFEINEFKKVILLKKGYFELNIGRGFKVLYFKLFSILFG